MPTERKKRFRRLSESEYQMRDRMEFAKQLKEARTHADLTVSDLSDISRITADYIYKLERGESPAPADERISQLSRAIGSNEDILFAAAGRISPEIREIIMDMPKETGAVIRKLKPLGRVGRAYVLERMSQAIAEVFEENLRQEEIRSMTA